MPAPSRSRSIGQVLKVLKEDFEDISISKIRFLEGEGLVSPERAPSGYRRYSEQDIERLRYILEVQAKHYLPLKVIREHLEKLDAGEQPVTTTTVEPPPLEPVVTPVPPERQPQAKRPLNVARPALLQMSGLTEPQLAELERHGLVAPRRGTGLYNRDAVTIAVAARKMATYGMDVRHLRAIKQAAEREAALIEQAVGAHGRRRPGSRQALIDVMQLVMYAHTAMLRSSITS